MRRKLALATLVLVAGALIALAALPWWLGAALGAAGGRFGLTFGEYRRMGYTRFALKDVKVARPGVEVTASRVELATPFLWLANKPGEVKAERWSVVATRSGEPKQSSDVRGWAPLRTQLDTLVTTLELWLPPTTLGAGEIRWDGGALQLAGAEWNATKTTRLSVKALAWRDQTADVVVSREKRDAPLIVEARAAEETWTARVESEGAQLSLNGAWAGQPVEATARFSETGWIPVEARATAANWNLPAARAGLPALYETIAGGATLTWTDRAGTVDVQVEGRAAAGGEAPPLTVSLHGAGGPDRLRIENLDIRVPGVEGRLSEPIVIGRDGRLQSGVSRFDLAVDLAKQPWFEGRGQVTGVVEVIPRDAGVPRVSARLSTGGATVGEWTMTKAEAKTDLQWPVLRVETAAVTLAGGDEVTLSGEADLKARTLTGARVRGRVSKETAARALSADATFDVIEIDAEAAGPWSALTHAGRAKATRLHVPPLKPLGLDVGWKGIGTAIDAVGVDIAAGGTRVNVKGAVGQEAARIDELVLTQGENERLRLVAPVQVRWTPTPVVEAFVLKGPEGGVEGRMRWGNAGDVALDVRQFPSEWLTDLVELPGPGWAVTWLKADGRWENGPLVFKTDAEAILHFERGRRAEIVVAAQGDERGVRVETLRASMGQQVVARASGTLPLTLHPGQAEPVRIDEAGALTLEAATEPNAVFWEQLGTLTGLFLEDPRVRIAVTGTARAPTGEGSVKIVRVAADSQGKLRRMPEVTDVDMRVTAKRGGVALEAFSFKIAGQAVRAEGRLPVEQWAELTTDPLAGVKARGEARIQILNAEVAALAHYAPAYLAPTGTLHVDLALKRGGEWEGLVRLKDAASRPLGPLGTLQEIGAEIVVNGRTVEFKELRATTGGQPVTLTGTAVIPDGKEPRLNLALRGEKVPFVRQAGMLMRGDLDVRIVTGDDDITRISGRTKLRDSFFLMDVRALIPRGGPRSAPGRRPPYFSVELLPFADWRLDVAVEGERFLRLRTPVFNGLTSARFRLGGTLRDPRAIGEAVVNQGRVLLPFATFEVRQGDVRLTQTNPFEPRIALIGTSRRYGYDLRMELRGTAEKPELTFTSTPPLESEQVLLMVMTGETPQNEVTYSGRERAARLGAYLGQSLLRQLGGDPEKDDRLTIAVGERISRQGRETYNAEYELNPRWSLVGEYDEFDEYNVGVKWRVWAKQPKEETADAAK